MFIIVILINRTVNVTYVTHLGYYGLKDMFAILSCSLHINHFKPEFIIGIFIQYKPRIAVAILDL